VDSKMKKPMLQNAWIITCPNGHTGSPDKMFEEYVSGEKKNENVTFIAYKLRCPQAMEYL